MQELQAYTFSPNLNHSKTNPKFTRGAGFNTEKREEKTNFDAIVNVNKQSIADKILANAEEIEMKREELKKKSDLRNKQ